MKLKFNGYVLLVVITACNWVVVQQAAVKTQSKASNLKTKLYDYKVVLEANQTEPNNHIQISSSEDYACYKYKRLNLTCMHPTVGEEGTSSAPSWKKNGNIILVDGATYQYSFLNKSFSVLSVLDENADEMENFTCLLETTSGKEESLSVSIKKIDEPLEPAFINNSITAWSVKLEWEHKKACFPCSFFFLIHLNPPTITGNTTFNASSTVYTIPGLTAGTNYSVTLQAVCNYNNGTIESAMTESFKFQTDENLQPEDIHLEIKPFPETEGKHACLNGYYQMICHHPDIQSQLDNHKVFYASSPSWKVDGVPIIIDGQLKNITTLTKFKTLLKLRIHPDIYKEKYYNFTCFLTLRNGSILESKALKVHIVGSAEVIYELRSHQVNSFLANWEAIAKCYRNDTIYELAWYPIYNGLQIRATSRSRKVQDTKCIISDLSSKYSYQFRVKRDIENAIRLSSSKSDVCIGDDIDLYCHYPITAGNCRSSQSQPDFHVNGTLISVTRVIENCPHDFSGSGDTSISFCIKWNVEKGGHSNLTCSNTYGECISIESKGLLIDPIVQPKPPRDLKWETNDKSETVITWNHDDTCFDGCTICFNISISGEKKKITRKEMNLTFQLKPNTNYTVAVFAFIRGNCSKMYENKSSETTSITIYNNNTKTDIVTTANGDSKVAVAVSVPIIIIITIIIIIIIIIIIVYCKKKQKLCFSTSEQGGGGDVDSSIPDNNQNSSNNEQLSNGSGNIEFGNVVAGTSTSHLDYGPNTTPLSQSNNEQLSNGSGNIELGKVDTDTSTSHLDYGPNTTPLSQSNNEQLSNGSGNIELGKVDTDTSTSHLDYGPNTTPLSQSNNEQLSNGSGNIELGKVDTDTSTSHLDYGPNTTPLSQSNNEQLSNGSGNIELGKVDTDTSTSHLDYGPNTTPLSQSNNEQLSNGSGNIELGKADTDTFTSHLDYGPNTTPLSQSNNEQLSNGSGNIELGKVDTDTFTSHLDYGPNTTPLSQSNNEQLSNGSGNIELGKVDTDTFTSHLDYGPNTTPLSQCNNEQLSNGSGNIELGKVDTDTFTSHLDYGPNTTPLSQCNKGQNIVSYQGKNDKTAPALDATLKVNNCAELLELGPNKYINDIDIDSSEMKEILEKIYK